LPTSQWSPPFFIEAAGSSEVVTFIVENEAYQFNVNTSLCKAPFTRTKTVVITPRFIFVNSLHFPVICKQAGDLSEIRIEPGETRPLYKWPNMQLPERLCFKRDGNGALWTNPISVSKVTDETMCFQGTDWSRLVRLEVQRGNSTFLLLSHQKPSLVPLVIVNRTVVCDVWVKHKGFLNWHHLSPESGYPFGVGEQSHHDPISFILGRLSTSGAETIGRIDFELSYLKENQFVIPWRNSDSHDIVFELEQRGPFQSVIISERLRSRDALCSSLSSIHSNVNDLISQWTTKKIELTELNEDPVVSDGFLQLNIIECSQFQVPSDSTAIYLTADAFGQTIRTPGNF
jgi:hypothetical protein